MEKVNFTINGEKYNLDPSEVAFDTTLFEFLRYHANLCGTKAMCQEGGCGACVVSVRNNHPVSKEKQIIAVNSCLVYIYSCHDWDITTVEGIGNRKDGYHAIQTRLAGLNGTQCGYCTPGWVANMYSLTEGGQKKLTSKQIENSFGSNMCRCTGYRPILDAFKSFASDAPVELMQKVMDLEDLDQLKCKKKCNSKCQEDHDWCFLEKDEELSLCLTENDSSWVRASSLEDVFKTYKRSGIKDCRIVNGNTGKGVYPSLTESKVLIDISSIPTLKEARVDVNLVLGAGMTLSDVMKIFEEYSTKEFFKYLEVFRKHLDLVAHVPVRNVGTIGGNLALKNAHKEFQSDVFLLLETVQSTVTIADTTIKKKEYKMVDFLNMDLDGKIIFEVKLPPLSASHLVRTYKIMPRAQNSHAIMNAGFLFKVDPKNNVEGSNIIFGAISSTFVHACETEKLLKGLPLFDNDTLKRCLAKLSDEIVPDDVLGEPSPFARKMIALGLFYKAILNLAPSDKVDDKYKSGGTVFDRDVSKGTQVFDTDKTVWPVNKALPKLEALKQCAGEVLYSDDVQSTSREVHVALILSTICKGEIESIDTETILKQPEVLKVFTPKDIPGKNSFTPTKVPWQTLDEEIMASSKINYYGQVIGAVAAKTRKAALRAAENISVKYKNVSREKPVLGIADALRSADSKVRLIPAYTLEAKDKGTDVTKVVKGSFEMPSQYHYTMETQTCSANVSEFGLNIRSSTQWVDLINVAVAEMLNIKENEVNITVTRLGGGYGGKASRSSLIACICSLVAYKLNRPTRLVLPLTDNMDAVGKRQNCRADYEIGINNEGVIQYMNLTYYSDEGWIVNDTGASSIGLALIQLYESSRWNVKGYGVLTDKASNTWCRAPITTEATAIMDHIMEHIAYATKNDPTTVRIKNMLTTHSTLVDMTNSFKTNIDYDQRLTNIRKYNTENVWKKRSIKLTPIAFPLDYNGNFTVTINVYYGDGTVAISHGGIEMGQGINTKTAQVCAYALKIPLEKITVKPSNNFVSPNNMATNGSYTSESVAFATMKACDELLKRLEKVKDGMTEPTWEELIAKAQSKGINLQTSYMFSVNDALQAYTVYAVTAAEVELDVLTGNHQVLRVDILEDTGRSLNPDIDVGQIEGAFMMGVGLWTSEVLKYDPLTGRLVTDRTWTYKPPGAKDIPIDFRVNFQRNNTNSIGVLRSKATGEPAVLTAIAVANALHDAVTQGRIEYGHQDTDWPSVNTPYSVENIIEALSPNIEYFKLHSK